MILLVTLYKANVMGWFGIIMFSRQGRDSSNMLTGGGQTPAVTDVPPPQ